MRGIALPRIFDAERPLSVNAGRMALALAIIAAWEFGADRLFESFYFSKPSLIALKFWNEIFDPGFYRDLWITAMEMVLGYTFGALAGVALGVFLARWVYISRIVDP